ncbi:MAG TPA: cysteine hydrolase family protein [Cellvibrio sp.]|nr:cysteine hydrolase family protein [Cellvibrio sp.]
MNIKNMTALIIIDQQKGIASPKLGYRNNQGAESVMLNLLSQWRKLGWPIFHIKHSSADPESVFWPEQEGFEFKPGFFPLLNEVMIEKKTPCTFSNTNLEVLLKEKGLKSIIVVGASTNNSVEATVRTGACKGFSVTVIEDACFAFSKMDYFGRERTAEEVHAMSLANLENEYASIIQSSEVKL